MGDRSQVASAAGTVLGVAACTGLARAQNSSSDSGGSALGDTIVWAITTAIEALFQPLKAIVQSQANNVVNALIGTPHPNAVFTTPTNGSWPDIYSNFWDGIVPLSLLLWALSVGIVILLESTSYLFSSYHRTKLK